MTSTATKASRSCSQYKLSGQVLEFEFLGKMVRKKALVSQYASGLLGIWLYDCETEEPFCTLSINAAGAKHPNEVVLKNYSEHEDWVDNSLIPFLEKHGLARLERFTEIGFTSDIPVISLTRFHKTSDSIARSWVFTNHNGETQYFHGFSKVQPVKDEEVTLALVSYEGDFECYFLESPTPKDALDSRHQLEKALLFMHGDDDSWVSNHTIRYYKPQ